MSILKLAKFPAILAAAALTAFVPAKAMAQGGVDLTPWAGAYIPTRNSISDLDNALSRDVSVIGGARLTFWGTGILGFDATGGYAPAKISGETINETNQNLLVASGRLLLALSPVTNRVGFYIGAGPALPHPRQEPLRQQQEQHRFRRRRRGGVPLRAGPQRQHGLAARPRGLSLQRRLRRRQRFPERPRGLAGSFHSAGRSGRLAHVPS